MHRYPRTVIILLIALTVFILAGGTVSAQTGTADTIYTVQPGDNLFRIALRFGVTTQALAEANGISDTSRIFAGQQLRIPSSSTTTSPQPQATAEPQPPASTATTTYTVQRGDTLLRIANQFNTTISEIVALNNLPNRNVIFVGQQLVIPAAGGPTSTTPTSPTTDTGTAPLPVGFGFGYGIEAFLIPENAGAVADEIVELGLGWVKHEVRWADIEPVQGQFDYSELDAIIFTLELRGLNILLTITTAPEWARAGVDEDGPPDDFFDFAVFMRGISDRYIGRIAAYEIWSEPNLRREWNSTVHPISAASYMDMLRQASASVKASDPNAVVVSAGLAPTGFNDGVNAIDDRAYLREMYVNGLIEAVDAVGAHPNGWANPPDSLCCEPSVGVLSHFDSPTFYFLDTLNEYRRIMVENSDAGTPIWVTEFGWGSAEDTDPPSETNIFFSYTSLGEQAVYAPRGFELGAELGFVGPMFLFNVNGCQVELPGFEPCYYSLTGPDGLRRPVFSAIQQLPKVDQSDPAAAGSDDAAATSP